jgi:hypothetical protein
MMILASIVFSGISALIWFLIKRFVGLGALKAFLIFLAVGPLYFLAMWLYGAAQEKSYRSDWTLPVGRVLGIAGVSVFAILSISPFFETWRAVTGFWPHLLLVFLGLWVITLLIYALIFLIGLFTD